jgi:hypothetical protein
MIKLTETREITPYAWVHPDDDDRRSWCRCGSPQWLSFRFNGAQSICANASAECRRTCYLKHRPIRLHLSFGWGNATVSLQTKKIKGLHENDFIMATKIDRIFARTAAA